MTGQRESRADTSARRRDKPRRTKSLPHLAIERRKANGRRCPALCCALGNLSACRPTPHQARGWTTNADRLFPAMVTNAIMARRWVAHPMNGAMMKDRSPLLRQWTLLRAISAAGGQATVKSLVEQTGVSEKTIRRDVALLRKVGFPVSEAVGEFGRKTFAIDGASVPPLAFTYDEALALFLCRRAISPLAGTFFWQSAQQALRKIRASLGKRAATYVERMLGRIHPTRIGGDYSSKAEMLDQLWIAIEDSKATFITYHSTRSTEPLTYDMHPYGIVEHRGSLYLVGHSQQHDELRHWKVDRIEEVEVTKVPFRRPADFDLEEHLAGSFGVYRGGKSVRVRVRFAPEAARYVREKTMHASQRVVPQQDGSVIAEFQLGSLVEVKSWILSFGRQAEVLEPLELIDEVASELRAALGTYTVSDDPQDRRQTRSHRRERPRPTG